MKFAICAAFSWIVSAAIVAVSYIVFQPAMMYAISLHNDDGLLLIIVVTILALFGGIIFPLFIGYVGTAMAYNAFLRKDIKNVIN